MKTLHTPGPWFIERRTRDNETPYYWVTASEGNGWANDRYMSVSGCIDEHDARLIAAAPELLEACLAMIEWDDRENDHAVDFHKRMELCELAFQKARAASAKATGEQS